jgi:hypothetical protein
MATPFVPPYLGTYEDIARALLHNPFLGSGHSGPRPHHEAVELNPQPLPPEPDPWRNAAVSYLASLVSMQELAKTIDNPEQAKQLGIRAERGISEFIDDYCGTPPRRIPWPFPGPPPWVATLAVQITSVANSQAGALRDGLLQVAGRIASSAGQVNAR